MGCHTIFYRKINRTQEEAKQSCLENLKYARNLAWKIYRKPKSYLGINWGTTKEYQLESVLILNRKIKAVSNDFYQRAVWNNQNDEDITVYVDGKGLYIEDTDYYYVFRKGNYPEDKLFSLQETLDYIKNNECIVNGKTFDKLEEFWDKYPNGMINFG